MELAETTKKESGLSTKKWGPSAWIFLHSCAQRYSRQPTPEDKETFGLFYTNIYKTLPCGKCRESYTEFLKILPIKFFLNDREHLLFWVYTIHNFVNFKLRGQGNKIGPIPTIEEVYKKFENDSCA